MRKLSLSTGTGMSRQAKSVPQAKKVMPPAVPELYGKVPPSGGGVGGGGGGGSVGGLPNGNAGGVVGAGVIYDTGDGAGRNGGTAVVAGTVIVEHHHPDGGPSVVNSVPVVNSASGVAGVADRSGVAPSVAPSSLLLRCGPDGIVDYGLDDQGIDLTQSPGRDSPVSLSGSAGSGSRHSTASLDSGRASSYLTGASNSSNRSVSGVGSYGVLSSPRCSVSSCSIGSGSGGGGGGGGAGCNHHRLSNHSGSGGGRNDHDVISEWLMEIHFHEYTYLFLDAGYDLPTIARMTPEDLTAIGIRKPNHRERLKRHIDALKLPDALPGYVPGSIEEWLRLLRLDEYVQPLLAQGYQTVHDVTQLTWEDLEDIGIVKLGHQKKILLAIKRVKDIISGKMVGGGGGGGGAGGYLLSPTGTTTRIAAPPTPASYVRAHYDDMSIGLRSDSSKLHLQQQQHHLAVAGSYSTFLRQQSTPAPKCEFPVQSMITYPHVHFDGTQAIYRRSSYDDSDITPTNEKSSALLALSGPDEHHFAVPQSQQQQQQQQQHAWLLHTQQHQMMMQHQQQQQQQQYFQGGGTLPRQHQRNSYGVRLALLPGGGNPLPPGGASGTRPIAKIVANNLKLPTVAAGSGAPVTDGTAAGATVVDDESGGGAPYPVPLPMPPLLTQIENVEMATAALDAMHFSNYTSSPYTVAAAVQQQQQQQQQHYLPLHHNVASSPPGAAPVAAGAVAPPPPIYHNHQSMLLMNHHAHGHHHPVASSAQSTPSPPTLAPGGIQQQQQPCVQHHAYGYAGQTLQTTAEVHKDNKSNSSLESIDQIPFANENAGTIKQRSSLNRIEHHFQSAVAGNVPQLPPHQHPSLLRPTLSSSSSSSSSSLTGSITTTTLVTVCSIQQQSIVPQSSSTSPSTPPAPAAAAATTTDKPVVDAAASSPGAGPPAAAAATAASGSQDIFGTNVLNDIGNMLANLTDELDAMLEEEKCAGISDNE